MSRIDALRRMYQKRPDDSRLQFGLALEYLQSGRTEEGIDLLEEYLATADDEGNGWGRLAAAYLEQDREDEARKAYREGIEAARRHGHPTMAEEFEGALEELGPTSSDAGPEVAADAPGGDGPPGSESGA
ncbi:MAG: tetratricopeptide repeat protein [Longimicrobiales bacterium]|nr:tetratricopeptide repeat protein [Longimicrobiales bacterium]